MQEYSIVKNCFAGRAGYSLTGDPESQRIQRLVSGGFIEPKEAPKPKATKASKREKKVVKPSEKK